MVVVLLTHKRIHVAGTPLAWMYVLKMEGDTVVGPVSPSSRRAETSLLLYVTVAAFCIHSGK